MGIVVDPYNESRRPIKVEQHLEALLRVAMAVGWVLGTSALTPALVRFVEQTFDQTLEPSTYLVVG